MFRVLARSFNFCVQFHGNWNAETTRKTNKKNKLRSLIAFAVLWMLTLAKFAICCRILNSMFCFVSFSWPIWRNTKSNRSAIGSQEVTQEEEEEEEDRSRAKRISIDEINATRNLFHLQHHYFIKSISSSVFSVHGCEIAITRDRSNFFSSFCFTCEWRELHLKLVFSTHFIDSPLSIERALNCTRRDH